MSAPAGAAPRLVVAMSGGVDSSLAAALALEAGFDAVGVTMKLSESGSRCCSLEDADDARRVCERLGIRFFVANYAEEFRSEVIEAFADSYLRGETPIPCVACNKRFKFELLLERARVFGAERVATGHYARIETDPESGRRRLLRARHREKDQSYFLFQLDQSQLEQAWFPLGEMSKAEVREHAREAGLVTADKPESQEICFVPDGDYAKVVEAIRPEARGIGGEIVDLAGEVLGRHSGVHHFTIGQRHGLGISSDRRLYVVRIDSRMRRVTVGERADLGRDGALVGDVNWIAGKAPAAGMRMRVQVRHRHRATPAILLAADAEERSAQVRFDEPVDAVAPGQAAVFYDEGTGDEVLGGGWIRGPVE